MAFEFPSTKTARKEKAQKEKDAKVEKAEKILGKKFKKYAESKEAQLHSKDFESGVDRAEKRAGSETMQEFKKMAKGGRAMYKSGMRVCKLAKRGKGRAYGKNS